MFRKPAHRGSDDSYTSDDFFEAKIEWITAIPPGRSTIEWDKYNSQYQFCRSCQCLFDPSMRGLNDEEVTHFAIGRFDKQDPRAHCVCPVKLSLVRRCVGDIKMDCTNPTNADVERCRTEWEATFRKCFVTKTPRQIQNDPNLRGRYVQSQNELLTEENRQWERLEIMVWNRAVHLRRLLRKCHRHGYEPTEQEWPSLGDSVLLNHIHSIRLRFDPWIDTQSNKSEDTSFRLLWCKKHQKMGHMYPVDSWEDYLDCGICTHDSDLAKLDHERVMVMEMEEKERSMRNDARNGERSMDENDDDPTEEEIRAARALLRKYRKRVASRDESDEEAGMEREN